jgi:fructosamine-3-kinase
MYEMKDLLNLISKETGLDHCNFQRVAGGDINSAWLIESIPYKYFVKINDATLYPLMFEKEAQGLDALKHFSSFRIPAVMKHGHIETHQYLILEWLEEKNTSPNDQMEAGKKLAFLHQVSDGQFGWSADNYIGSLPQVNKQHRSWSVFYSECRIMPMVQKLYDQQKLQGKDLDNAESFCQQLHSLFPEEPPSLLHGDLWSGNFMSTTQGPAIFDPSVYYGHREIDLAMTKLFGGFDESFYAGYQEIFPLEKGWKERLNYAQLYPLLVHAVLFNGNYTERVKNILSKF